MLTVEIKGRNDQNGSGHVALVTDEGALTTVVHPHPPREETVYPFLWSQFLTDNGTSTGDNDMIVVGSTAAPLDFYVGSNPNYTIWVNRISIRISDPGANLDEFGALPALTNGVEFFYETPEDGRIIIIDQLQTNLDLVRLAGGKPSFGTTTNAFRADVSGGGGEDTYLPVIDINDQFGVQWGVRLRPNTIDKIGFTIKDNLTGISTFNMFATGMRINEEH